MGDNIKNKVLFVLIACEESQVECKAFRQLGHIAFSCDIQKCKKSANPDWHIYGDCSPYLLGSTKFITQSGINCCVPRWDLIIAHPPCTYLCKVGSIWLYKNPDKFVYYNNSWLHINGERFAKLLQARQFFFLCLNAKAKYVAVENPLPMRLAGLPAASTFACPSWFGSKYTKKTLYWLKNLPGLFASNIVVTKKSFVHFSRGKYRSRTFEGLAEAIAFQWSDFIINDQ